METIYNIEEVVDKINDFSQQIENERTKKDCDEKKVKDLIYAQLIQGLKLTTKIYR